MSSLCEQYEDFGAQYAASTRTHTHTHAAPELEACRGRSVASVHMTN